MAKEIYENALAEAFPAVDAGVRPFGSRVLVQIRTPRKVSKGGIIFSTGDQDTEKWNTQVAKIVALGPVAFKNRTTLEHWPEGSGVQLGNLFVFPSMVGTGGKFLSLAPKGLRAMMSAPCLFCSTTLTFLAGCLLTRFRLRHSSERR